MYLLDFSIRHQYGRFCIAMEGGGEAGAGGGGRGLRSGTEKRCSYKAVTLHGGQRISAKETIQ